MQFSFEGASYRLEFQYDYRDVVLVREGGKEKTICSKYPYTITKLLATAPGTEPVVVALGTVGCMPNDQFSKRKGREYALKALCFRLRKLNRPKQFSAALWQAYLTRGGKPQISVAVSTLPALPPATEVLEKLQD